MATIGFHASHEQFSPRALLALVQEAQRFGFRAVMSSDHLAPWSSRQGHSGFAWSWLGAAMQATGLPFGSLAIPGGWRYHPVILAQAAATLAEMFPGRLSWIAAGSGEAVNEHVVGTAWPAKAERNARLKAGVDIIRALWAGETVTGEQAGIKVHRARLWSLPDTPPRIYGAALSVQTAEWLGSWADGLITVAKPLPQLKALLEAFRRGGGQGKPAVLQVHVSWAGDPGEAWQQAWEQWRTNVLGSEACAEFRLPEEFDRAADGVSPEALGEQVSISSDLAQHVGWLREYLELGFEEMYLHNVGRNQREFIEAFGREVLPALRGTSRS